MEYRDFVEQVKEQIQDFLPEKFADAAVEVNQIVKNNDCVLDGLMVRTEESNISPTIYLNPYFEQIQDGAELDDILAQIASVYQSHYIDHDIDVSEVIVSIMYTQLFNLLCDRADDVYGGRLPIHVRCLLDEFANIGQIPKFEKLIATIRSREISASIILQSKSQLKAIYKDNADTIEGNCDTTLFLGGKEKTTLKEIAEILGKETIDLYNTSDTRGSQRSYGMNYQKTGKELMSQDEIAVMDGGKCILQVRGVRPFFSNKYDICKHKNYKYLSDYDKKNIFDIEKYLSTNLILKPEDEVELYQM